MKGILNIDKPKNMTSHDVVSKVRKILSTKAVGHFGTLDPQGTGVLLVGVGKATRLFDYLLKKDKEYIAEFTFGYETDTLDGDGTVINSTEVIPSKDKILEAANTLIGKQKQIPPKYSAKNIGGKRAYDMARNGEDFSLPATDVEIFNIELIKATSDNAYLFKIHCSSGTYIRSICRDIAYFNGSLATMTSIRRTRAGNFEVKNSVSIETLQELKEKALLPMEEALIGLYKFELDNEYFQPLLNGIKIPIDLPYEQFSVYCKNELFGIGKVKDGILKIDTYLRD